MSECVVCYISHLLHLLTLSLSHSLNLICVFINYALFTGLHHVSILLVSLLVYSWYTTVNYT